MFTIYGSVKIKQMTVVRFYKQTLTPNCLDIFTQFSVNYLNLISLNMEHTDILEVFSLAKLASWQTESLLPERNHWSRRIVQPLGTGHSNTTELSLRKEHNAVYVSSANWLTDHKMSLPEVKPSQKWFHMKPGQQQTSW